MWKCSKCGTRAKVPSGNMADACCPCGSRVFEARSYQDMLDTLDALMDEVQGWHSKTGRMEHERAWKYLEAAMEFLAD